MTEAIEVIARLGDTVLDVRYVTDGRYAIGGHHFAIEPHARPRTVRLGLVELSLRSVARPHPSALRPPIERRLLSYLAGSLAVHLAVWATAWAPTAIGVPASLAEPDPDPFTIESATLEPGSFADLDDHGSSEPLLGGVEREVLEHVPAAEPPRQPTLSRAEAIEAARHASFLDLVAARADVIAAFAGTGDALTAFDRTGASDLPFYDLANEQLGSFGHARSGGLEAICDGSCRFLIGSGRYRTSGELASGQRELRDQLHRKHDEKRPTVLLCAGPRPCMIAGELDKAIVRRYIKRELPKLQYCYEKELLADSTIAGTLTAQFLIATDGTVQAVHTEGVAQPINDCVAAVIKNIKFPRSLRESTQVAYPFTFRAAG